MINLINFLTSKEATVVYVIALTVSIINILYYLIKKYKPLRLKKQNTMELKRLALNVKEQIEKDKETKISLATYTEENPAPKKEILAEIKETPVIKQEMPVTNVMPKEEKIETITVQETQAQVVKEEKVNINKEVPKKQHEFIEEANAVIIKPIETLEEVKVEPVIEELKYTSITPKKEEALDELKKVEERLENNKKQDNIELTEFERIQEDTAIISLDELMKKAGKLYAENEENGYQDEGNEPISITEIEERRKETITKEEIKEDFEVTITPIEELYTYDHKFKETPVISPVYGLRNEEARKSTEIELENTANYEKFDLEIKKTNKFIRTLKDLQNNLD